MKTFRYWYSEYEDFEYNVDKYDCRARIRTLLCYDDKTALIDFIMDYVPEEDLLDYFEDELKDYFEEEAMEWYKENK